MQSPNPRSLFVCCFQHKMELAVCSVVYNGACANSCLFRLHFEKIAVTTFNLKARNFVASENDKIARAKRPATGTLVGLIFAWIYFRVD